MVSPLFAQCVEVLPALFTLAPRDASLGFYSRTPTSHQLASLVDDREGVVHPPWFRKRRDGAVGLNWESFNACFSSFTSGDNQSSWAIVSLAGGGLANVEERECQGENEKTHLS